MGVSHAATCRIALRKVEAASTFSATCNAIFRCETSCKHGMSHEEVFLATYNATPLRCKLQGKLHRVTWPYGNTDVFSFKDGAKTIPAYRDAEINLDPLEQNGRPEWCTVRYYGIFCPDNAYVVQLRWLISTGSVINELVNILTYILSTSYPGS